MLVADIDATVVAVAELLVTVNAAAAPVCTTAKAVAAVLVVPFTVSATTLAAVGLITVAPLSPIVNTAVPLSCATKMLSVVAALFTVSLFVPTVAVPTARRLFVASKNRLALSWLYTPLAPANTSEP